MSNDLSTQLPKPPELHAMPSARATILRVFSLILTGGGIALMLTGGWLYVRQQVEANQPPPARILEVSVADLESTPIAQMTQTLAQSLAADDVNADNNVQPSLKHPTKPARLEPAGVPAVEPSSRAEDTIPTPNAETVPIETPKASVTVPFEESVLSLADNPLPVVEDEQELAANNEQSEATTVDGTAIDSPLSRIVAESISLDSGVTPVGWVQVINEGIVSNVWTVADYAAGWHKNSTLPGQGGNIVMSAHHNIKGEVFRYIVDLEPGDVVTLYDDMQQPFDYVIEDKFIVKDKGEPEAVRRENAKWIGLFNEERLTMVTCWPYNNNTHRLIVIGKPAGETQALGQ